MGPSDWVALVGAAVGAVTGVVALWYARSANRIAAEANEISRRVDARTAREIDIERRVGELVHEAKLARTTMVQLGLEGLLRTRALNGRTPQERLRDGLARLYPRPVPLPARDGDNDRVLQAIKSHPDVRSVSLSASGWRIVLAYSDADLERRPR